MIEPATKYPVFTAKSEFPVTWLAISSFRNDREVIELLHQANKLSLKFFDRILVVDSLGTGAIPALIEQHSWGDVIYRSYDRNLGAAGNLYERLKIAAESGADRIYALNHDGRLNPDVIRALLEQAVRLNHFGAVYPLSYLNSATAYNVTGSRRLPLPAKLVREKPQKQLLEAYWSSCNGALYSTEPARSGILPDPGIWHGWEDLDYGLRLNDRGYRQVIVCSAVFEDNYEYVNRTISVGSYRVVDKPSWITYYTSRNLILIARWARPVPLFGVVVTMRVFRECLVIFLFRRNKIQRLKYLAQGVIDGLRNRKGKWVLP